MEMLILDAIDESIEGVLAGAVTTTQPDFTAHYADNDGSTFTEGSNDGVFNSTTDVELVAAPAASTRRLIKNITVFNRDTVAITFTLKFVNGASERTLIRKTLNANESWDFSDERGLQKLLDDTTPKLGGDLDLNEHNILLKDQPATDHTASGIIANLTAGTALAFGDICYMGADAKMEKGDADAVANSTIWAMCIDATIAEDAAGNFLLVGFARDDTWNWGTLGGTLYLDTVTAGGMTQTAPSGADDVVKIVGYAITADIIYFNPEQTMVVHV